MEEAFQVVQKLDLVVERQTSARPLTDLSTAFWSLEVVVGQLHNAVLKEVELVDQVGLMVQMGKVVLLPARFLAMEQPALQVVLKMSPRNAQVQMLVPLEWEDLHVLVAAMPSVVQEEVVIMEVVVLIKVVEVEAQVIQSTQYYPQPPVRTMEMEVLYCSSGVSVSHQ